MARAAERLLDNRINYAVYLFSNISDNFHIAVSTFAVPFYFLAKVVKLQSGYPHTYRFFVKVLLPSP